MITKQKVAKTTTDHYDKLVGILGKKYIKSKIATPFDFITLGKAGKLPF